MIVIKCPNIECSHYDEAVVYDPPPVVAHFMAWPQLRCIECGHVPWVVA